MSQIWALTVPLDVKTLDQLLYMCAIKQDNLVLAKTSCNALASCILDWSLTKGHRNKGHRCLVGSMWYGKDFSCIFCQFSLICSHRNLGVYLRHDLNFSHNMLMQLLPLVVKDFICWYNLGISWYCLKFELPAIKYAFSKCNFVRFVIICDFSFFIILWFCILAWCLPCTHVWLSYALNSYLLTYKDIRHWLCLLLQGPWNSWHKSLQFLLITVLR